MKCCFTVISIRVSSITNAVEYFSYAYGHLCIDVGEKSVQASFPIFELDCFLLLNFKNSY
jgi:hypothetical protein